SEDRRVPTRTVPIRRSGAGARSQDRSCAGCMRGKRGEIVPAGGIHRIEAAGDPAAAIGGAALTGELEVEPVLGRGIVDGQQFAGFDVAQRDQLEAVHVEPAIGGAAMREIADEARRGDMQPGGYLEAVLRDLGADLAGETVKHGTG